jgi:hypothetical protein
MRFNHVLKVSAMVWLLLSGSGEARKLTTWSEAELEAKASLICEGTVLSIKETGVIKDFGYGDGSVKASEEVMLARIKVLRVLKGHASAEIDFRYRVPEPPTSTTDKNVATSVSHFVVDGPQHIALMNGSIYRFFLKPDPIHAGYLNILEGDFDDKFAVQGPQEE